VYQTCGAFFILSGRLRREAKQTTELLFRHAKEKMDQMCRNCEEQKNPEKVLDFYTLGV